MKRRAVQDSSVAKYWLFHGINKGARGEWRFLKDFMERNSLLWSIMLFQTVAVMVRRNEKLCIYKKISAATLKNLKNVKMDRIAA